MLRDALHGPEMRHELVLLFGTARTVTRADHTLGVASCAGRRIGFSPLAMWRLWRLIHRIQPDVAVAHGRAISALRETSTRAGR